MIKPGKYSLKEFKNLVKIGGNSEKLLNNINKENERNNSEYEKTLNKKLKPYQVDVRHNGENFNSIDADYNRTTLDIEFSAEPSVEYKERVKSQVHGYPSVENEKISSLNKEFTKKNEVIYQRFDKRSKAFSDAKTELKHSGLTANKFDKSVFKPKTMFKEDKIKKLHFKHTTFLNENSIFNRVPDHYKVDGNKFIMVDKTNTEYLIECKVKTFNDYDSSFVEYKVLSKINKGEVNEQLSRIKQLFDYDTKSNVKTITAENKVSSINSVTETLNKVKKLQKIEVDD